MARKRETAGNARAQELARLPLMQFVAEASKDYAADEPGGLMEPVHLAPFIEELEATERAPIRLVSSVPVQHGKTTCLQYAIVWRLLRNPKLSVIYATYGQEFASANAVVMRQIAERVGLEFDPDMNTIKRWKTVQGGGLLSTSIGGLITGWPAKLLVVDDYYANREEAESFKQRAIVQSWFNADAQSRVGPSGSIIVNASRRHVDDLSGYLLARTKGRPFRGLNLPAISEQGEALCPWGPDPEDPRDLQFLHDTRDEIGDYDFESLYQGNPRPASGAVFLAPTYAPRPTEGRITVGLDLAYTAGAQADYSAAVALQWTSPDTCHVVEVARWQCDPTSLAANLRAFLSNYPGVTPSSFVSGPERAVFSLLSTFGVRVSLRAATGIAGSKYLRSQRTAAAWNSGRITIPQADHWVSTFVRELELFSGGAGDAHDDQVDALASAFEGGAAAVSPAGGHPVRPLRR